MDTNLLIDLICFITALVLLLTTIYQYYGKKRTILNKLFIALISGIIAIFVLDMIGWGIDGEIFPGSVTLAYVINTLYWIGQTTYLWFWLIYVCFYAIKQKKTLLTVVLYTGPVWLIEVIVLIINIWTGMIFKIDPVTSTYSRSGTGYYLNLIPLFTLLLSSVGITVVETIISKDFYQRRKCFLLLLYGAMPITGILIQTFSKYGLTLIWPFCTITLLMLFITDQLDQLSSARLAESLEREKRMELEKELVDQNVNIMLSQIQPHFLYNVLTTITQLCDIDPKIAKQATIDFSRYLRANIDSITETKPIPFETELEHIKKYISLEKLRFEDDLNVIYDIRTMKFVVPTISIQPLVENAVKYGVGQKENGGTIIISTREYVDSFVVTIKDDGVGFDVTKIDETNKAHIGIKNARRRLKLLVDGTISVESKLGVGTIVTVTIPKEKTL